MTLTLLVDYTLQASLSMCVPPTPSLLLLELGPSCPQGVSQGVFFDTPLLAWYP